MYPRANRQWGRRKERWIFEKIMMWAKKQSKYRLTCFKWVSVSSSLRLSSSRRPFIAFNFSVFTFSFSCSRSISSASLMTTKYKVVDRNKKKWLLKIHRILIFGHNQVEKMENSMINFTLAWSISPFWMNSSSCSRWFLKFSTSEWAQRLKMDTHRIYLNKIEKKKGREKEIIWLNFMHKRMKWIRNFRYIWLIPWYLSEELHHIRTFSKFYV